MNHWQSKGIYFFKVQGRKNDELWEIRDETPAAKKTTQKNPQRYQMSSVSIL